MGVARIRFLGKDRNVQPWHKNDRLALKFNADLARWDKKNEQFNKAFRENAEKSKTDKTYVPIEVDEEEYTNHLIASKDLPYQFLIDVLELNATEIEKLDRVSDNDIMATALKIRNELLELTPVSEDKQAKK